MKLQFRLRPTESLLDVDPRRIRKALGGPSKTADLQIIDNRASDATFVTMLVTLAALDPQTLEDLRLALLSVPRVRAFIVDGAGNETAVGEIPSIKLGDFVTS